MAVDILYFAWVREKVGRDRETLEVPPEAMTLCALADWLATLSQGHRAALGDKARLRGAIDQRLAGMGDSIAGAKEIAFFPPVTGG